MQSATREFQVIGKIACYYFIISGRGKHQLPLSPKSSRQSAIYRPVSSPTTIRRPPKAIQVTTMAAFHEATVQWHSGEEQMHALLHVPPEDNPTQPFLPARYATRLQASPLLVLGTLDASGRPWTTILGGEPGFTRGIAQSIIGIKTCVDKQHDPVITALLGSEANGEVKKEEGEGRMVSGLGIDLQSRDRVKIFGRMVVGCLSPLSPSETSESTTPDTPNTSKPSNSIAEMQLVLKITQSLGNCPKYLNKKHITPHTPSPILKSTSIQLPQSALDLIAKADLFFISSSHGSLSMDTNHRGGSPGFVRILSNSPSCTLVWPEYSGNRLYQTLGNLHTTPKAGLVFPDFETGDVLYLTGSTEILAAEEARAVICRSNLAVKFTVEAARWVRCGLGFRGEAVEMSPYNPPVRLLASESRTGLPESTNEKTNAITVRLVEKVLLAPTIARFRFHIDDPNRTHRWKPGQYVALNFSQEMSLGYSHMRDDDPGSLNDDFLRTFTVSSSPGERQDWDQFEITIRKVGVVTEWMFGYRLRTEMEARLGGFGGEFFVEMGEGETERIAFVAAGVGITPLLGQVGGLEMERVDVYWTVRGEDLGLVVDSLERIEGLGRGMRLFVTGLGEDKGDDEALRKIRDMGVRVECRRLGKQDLELESGVERWYVCTGAKLQKELVKWLDGQKVISEEFTF